MCMGGAAIAAAAHTSDLIAGRDTRTETSGAPVVEVTRPYKSPRRGYRGSVPDSPPRATGPDFMDPRNPLSPLNPCSPISIYNTSGSCGSGYGSDF